MDDPGENLYIKKEDEEIDSLPLPTLMCECRSSRAKSWPPARLCMYAFPCMAQ